MDSLIDFAKHNYDLITLLVAVLGVLLGVISLFYEMKKKKRQKAAKAEVSTEKQPES
jgi:mannose/fructose/N-acetylgalactosamine-specific phosphotransferase system component IIC